MASARESAGSKTPPPAASIRTPPAPRLGYHDSWEPFSPRKSARISSQRRAADRTPSPVAAHSHQLRSPRTAKQVIVHSNKSITSPMASPQKRPQPASESRRQASGSLTAEGTANAATALGLNTENPVHTSAGASVSQASGMLPTPSKTPRKPPNEQDATMIRSFARNLFPSDQQPVPSPQKKRSKKYSGVTLESFTAEEEEEEPISIFTDSHDRVPERDDSESNPFFGNSAAEPRTRQSKRRLVHIPGEGMQSLDEASRRDDGMVYVFRGKKFFRKFAEQEQPEDQDDAFAEGEGSRISGPLTRASVQPRLLFPTRKTTEEDEEALTDVEDMNLAKPVPQTPRKQQSTSAETPEAPRFAPVSPPDTRRTTRSSTKLADTPMKAKATGRKSPFDSWPRTKEHKVQPPAGKRSGESLASVPTKRTRS
ncbi:hypothetical protein E4U42_006976 [Claviceps africana]|uniref:Uncharacterized protein n=1 Tax=Claviceps africana TaxID=83212 RepID=A0A8K0NL71_9HYPO|nr:hypothetical protein E4U42_006976 [Claviceps africana]